MSKQIATKSMNRSGSTTIKGRPVAVLAGTGSQVEICYEADSALSFTVKGFQEGQSIPDAASHVATVGSAANVWHLYAY